MQKAKLCENKIRTIATIAKNFVDSDFNNSDKTLAKQIVGIGIRKIHDHAECNKGKGKYLGHPHWSKKAIALLKENNNKTKGIVGKLRSEHVIPINYLVNNIIFKNEKGIDIEIYEGQILKHSLVAILEKEENKAFSKAFKEHGVSDSMPKDWSPNHGNPFARYELAELINHIENA